MSDSNIRFAGTHMTMQAPLSRRMLLRSAGKVAFTAPFLAPLLPSTRAAAAETNTPPFRFILIRDTMGFGHAGRMADGPAPHRLVPPKARDAKGVPLAFASLPQSPVASQVREVAFTGGDDLPASLQPLRRFWANTIVADRFFNPHGVGLHGNGRSMFTVATARVDDKPAPVMQDLIAQHLSGGKLPFELVTLGQKSDTPVRYHQRLFGGIGNGAQGTLQQRKSVFAVVRAQAARAKPSLGKQDNEWMEQYLQGLASAETSLERLAAWECKVPPAPSNEQNLSQYEPVKPLLSHANLDMAATALTCGLTRVASLEFVPSRGAFQFLDPNPNTYNLNGALSAQAIAGDTRYADLAKGIRLESAAGGDNGGNAWGLDRHDGHHAAYVGMQTAVDRWEAALVARLIDKLQAAREGAGTMWDHTLILWVNSGGGIHHYGVSDHPAILLGGNAIMGTKAGQLRGGRYLSYAKRSHCMSDLYVTVAQALGLNIAKFGDPAICQGPLPGMRV